MDSILELFCAVDDFCTDFLPIYEQQLVQSGLKMRHRNRSLTWSEITPALAPQVQV